MAQDLIQYDLGLFMGENLDDRRRANAETLNAILMHAAITGRRFRPPPGRVEVIGTLRGQNGASVEGEGALGERSDGSFTGSEIVFFNPQEPALSLEGTGESVDSRMQCTWRGVALRSGLPDDTAKGILCAWNMRGEPLLDQVLVKGFGDHGVFFNGPNWQVATRFLRIDSCGNRVPGASGLAKDPKVDGSSWNGMLFDHTTAEGCGNESSEAGGIDLRTLNANRGLRFSGRTTLQSNRGRREMLVTNMAATRVDEIYMERVQHPVQTIGAEFVNCSGRVDGGFMTIDKRVLLGAVTKGTRTVMCSDAALASQGMLIEAPGLLEDRPVYVTGVDDGVIHVSEAAIGSYPRVEVRLRMDGTRGLLFTDSPNMSCGFMAYNPTSWTQNFESRSRAQAAAAGQAV